jgi:hypothetical protein
MHVLEVVGVCGNDIFQMEEHFTLKGHNFHAT